MEVENTGRESHVTYKVKIYMKLGKRREGEKENKEKWREGERKERKKEKRPMTE
jgi:hypothetical protein